MQMNLSLFDDIPLHEPPLQASYSPIPRIRIWPIQMFIYKCCKLVVEEIVGNWSILWTDHMEKMTLHGATSVLSVLLTLQDIVHKLAIFEVIL